MTDGRVEPKEAIRAALSMFIAYMTDKPESVPTMDSIFSEYPAEDLLRGMAVVASDILLALQDHAAEDGCECGSLAWLEQARISTFGRDH